MCSYSSIMHLDWLAVKEVLLVHPVWFDRCFQSPCFRNNERDARDGNVSKISTVNFSQESKSLFYSTSCSFFSFFFCYIISSKPLYASKASFFSLAELQNGNSCPSRNIIQYKDFRNERSKELKLIVFRAHVKIATGILGLN